MASEDNTLHAYISQVEADAVALFLVKLFNKETGDPAFMVDFMRTSTLQMKDHRGNVQVYFQCLLWLCSLKLAVA